MANKQTQSVHEILTDGIRKRWKVFGKELKSAKKDLSEENVHELRVASRRLASSLFVSTELASSFASPKTTQWASELIIDIQTLRKSLGKLRDTHVQLESIHGLVETTPELAEFKRYLVSREEKLTSKSPKRLRRFDARGAKSKISKICKRLSSKVDPTKLEDRGQQFVKDAHLYVDVRYLTVKHHRSLIHPQDLDSFHNTRLAFKQFKYAVEILRPVLTEMTDETFAKIKRYQRALGAIQDGSVMIDRYLKFKPLKDSSQSAQIMLKEFELQRRSAIRTFFGIAHELQEFWTPSPLALAQVGHSIK